MSTTLMNTQIKLRPHQIRGVDAMSKHNKGQLIKPTGAGKTLTMIADALKEFAKETPQTIVVVAPRILLHRNITTFLVRTKLDLCAHNKVSEIVKW